MNPKQNVEEIRVNRTDGFISQAHSQPTMTTSLCKADILHLLPLDMKPFISLQMRKTYSLNLIYLIFFCLIPLNSLINLFSYTFFYTKSDGCLEWADRIEVLTRLLDRLMAMQGIEGCGSLLLLLPTPTPVLIFLYSCCPRLKS